MIRSDYGPFVAVIDGADAGAYTLPAAIVVARRGLEAINQRIDALPPAPRAEVAVDDTAQRLAADVARTGVLPDDLGLDGVAEVRAAAQRHADAAAILDILREAARRNLYDVVRAYGEVTIVEHLRPAFEETLAVLRDKIAPALAGVSLTDVHAWVRAPNAARDAYKRLDEAVPRLASIQAARSAIALATFGISIDGVERPSARFSWLRNPDEVWPHRRLPRPWPEDPRERAIWMVTSDAEPWLPTPDEEVAAWQAAEDLKPPRLRIPHSTVGPTRSAVRPDVTSRRLTGGSGPQRVVIPAD